MRINLARCEAWHWTRQAIQCEEDVTKVGRALPAARVMTPMPRGDVWPLSTFLNLPDISFEF